MVEKIEAIDELKLTQDLINYQENLHFRVFGWAIGIVTTLTIGFFHKSVDLHPIAYMVCGMVSISIFFWVAKRHWMIFYAAIVRSRNIEDELAHGEYTEFKLNRSLSIDMSKIKLNNRMRLYAPYLALYIIVIFSGMWGLCSI